MIDNSFPNRKFLAQGRPVLGSSDFLAVDHPREEQETVNSVVSATKPPSTESSCPHTETQCTRQDDWAVINIDSPRAEIINRAKERGGKFSPRGA